MSVTRPWTVIGSSRPQSAWWACSVACADVTAEVAGDGRGGGWPRGLGGRQRDRRLYGDRRKPCGGAAWARLAPGWAPRPPACGIRCDRAPTCALYGIIVPGRRLTIPRSVFPPKAFDFALEAPSGPTSWSVRPPLSPLLDSPSARRSTCAARPAAAIATSLVAARAVEPAAERVVCAAPSAAFGCLRLGSCESCRP